ncbi:MAG TPA: sulfurtransferase [Candidatus Limnocylindrales bacterium]
MARHPLISVEDLGARVDVADPSLRIVDVRWVLGQPGAGRRAYEVGHLPGALFVDIDGELAADPERGPGRHPLPEVGAFVRRLEALGIGDEHLVVAYDDAGGWVASRLWWMLEDLGHEPVVVLDGGIGAWTAAGRPLTGEVVRFEPATLTVRDRWTRTIELDALRGRLGDVVLLDARGAPRYRGETEPIDAYPGHIPTSVSAPTDGNLAPDGRFLAPDALRARFAALGAAASTEVVTSCGSGVSACHNALAMRLADLPDPLLYVGSYSDWTRHGLPVATGLEPGRPPAGD